MERFLLMLQSFKIYLKNFRNITLSSTECTFKILKTCFNWLRTKTFHFGTDAGQETGILAISMMVNRNLHPLERFLWFTIVTASILVTGLLSMLQYKRFMTSPTVVSVDRNYRGWNGTLPAVTLCYYEHIDTYKANEFILDVWNISIFDDDFQYFMNFLYAVVNASVKNYVDLARYANDERFDDIDLFDLVRSIDRPFEQVLSSFDSDYEMQVLPVMTERGSCYAINSPMSAILTGSYVEFTDLKPPLICQYGKQQCYIKLDLYESTGTIDVHSPYEVSAIDASVIGLQKSDEITASYKVMETVASKNLRELSIEQRKCVFHDEETAKLKIYSQTLCLVRCRALMALEMCNCVPFFYPFVDGPSCNPDGFDCLLDYKWPIWALHMCKCPSTCTEIGYDVQTVKKRTWGIKSTENNLNYDVATSSFRWDLIPPKVRMRRDVVFSYEDLLVSFGGVLALFLGFSILSITQLAFVLIWHCIQNTIDLFVAIRNAYFHLCSCSKKRCGTVVPVMSSAHTKTKIESNLKIKRQRLLEVHHKPSEDTNTEAEDQQNYMEENLPKPEFQFIN